MTIYTLILVTSFSFKYSELEIFSVFTTSIGIVALNSLACKIIKIVTWNMLRTHEGKFSENKSLLWLLSIVSNALNRYNKRDYSLRTQLCLSYNHIGITMIVRFIPNNFRLNLTLWFLLPIICNVFSILIMVFI